MKIAVLDDDSNDLNYVKSLLERNFNDHDFSFSKCPEMALKEIDFLNIDLLILDINMPKKNGFEFLDELKTKNVEVIFSTAEDKFALKAYENYALGYLLKPYSEADFISVVTKAIHRIKSSTTKLINTKKTSISIPTLGCVYFLNVDEIIRVESVNNYAQFFTNDDVYISSYGLNYYLDCLDSADLFFRTHKSHIVNVKYVSKYYSDGSLILKNGDNIPVSRRKRDLLLSFLKSK